MQKHVLTARIVTWFAYGACWVFGHDVFSDHRFDYAWCVKCGKKWRQRKPLLGEFYD